MDATRPSTGSDGGPGQRFYVICEAEETFRAVSSGYGNGRSLPGRTFSNERECARNFSNAEGSNLTMGGAYLTAETRTSFKGYFSDGGERVPFTAPSFCSTAWARRRTRASAKSAAMWRCSCAGSAATSDPESPHADDEGFVPYGRLVNYTAGAATAARHGRKTVADEIIALVEGSDDALHLSRIRGHRRGGGCGERRTAAL
jgi:hypothetical protein